MSMTANRHEGIRAALCHDAYTATVAREHNDANVLCFGERIVGHGVCESILDAWIIGGFDGGRHINRVTKDDALAVFSDIDIAKQNETKEIFTNISRKRVLK